MIEWLPTKVTWYVDGVVLRSNNNTAPGIPTLSAKIMMNLWVFGSAGAFGNPANNKYPFHSTYDWFRYYKWDMETTYPMDDPTKLPQTDVIYSQNNSNETHYP
jgi:beta-glucanase (GH16 family)